MAIKRIPNLISRNYGDQPSWYWQPQPRLKAAGWQAVALGKDEAEAFRRAEELNDQVTRWRRHETVEVNVKPLPVKQTLPAVIAHYQTALPDKPAWPNLKNGAPLGERTRDGYRTAFARLEQWLGDCPMSAVTEKMVHDYKRALYKTIGAAPAKATLVVLRLLYTYAIQQGLYEGRNPALKLGLGGAKRRNVVWDKNGGDRDLQAMKAGAREAGYPELCFAFDLFEYLGQREADMIALRCDQWREIPRWHLSQLSDDAVGLLRNDDGPDAGKVMGFYVTQGKTDEPLGLPVGGGLRREVEAAIRRNKARGIETVLCCETGGHAKKPRSWLTTREFWSKFNLARAAAVALATDPAHKAHLARLTVHDLRRTAIVRMGELGLSDQFIAAVSGHSLASIKQMLEHYMPRNVGMAGAAFAARLEAREAIEARAASLLPPPPLALPAPDHDDDDEADELVEVEVVAVEPAPQSLPRWMAAPEPEPEPLAVAAAVAKAEAEFEAREQAKRSAQARKGGFARAAKQRDNFRLSDEQVLFIRRAPHSTPLKHLAGLFGVSDKTISAVRHGRLYRDLTDDGRALPQFG